MSPLVAVLAVLVVPGTLATSCPPDMLAVYSLALRTEWSEDRFPKQYPQWRPPAQWSKTIGYVHSVASPLFSVGAAVSAGVRQFAETGATDQLEMETKEKLFLDAVLAPPIPAGVGDTNTTIFVDSNHTKVSVMTKLVPSPDWFIGLDSLDLCSQGAFVESVVTEAAPLDGGTDNGFTFTSPNWATQPPDAVFTITSSYPAHPAGSFNYPHLAALPTLAVYSLTKLREYKLQQNYETAATTSAPEPPEVTEIIARSNEKTKKFQYKIVDADAETAVTKEVARNGNDIIEFIPVERRVKKVKDFEIATNEVNPEAVSVSSPSFSLKKNQLKLLGSGAKPSKGFRSFSSVAGGYHASTSPDSFFKKKYSSAHLDKVQQKVFPGKLESISKADLYKQIMTTYINNNNVKKTRKRKKRLRRKKNRGRHHKKPRDCVVTEWSSWGPCSKTCGIGETERTRVVTQHPAHGGRHCPALRDYKWCGSARNCNKGYFSW